MLQKIKKLFAAKPQKLKEYPKVLKSEVFVVSIQDEADKLPDELYGHLVVIGNDLIVPCKRIYGDLHVMNHSIFLDLEVVGGKAFVLCYGVGYMPVLKEIVGGYHLMDRRHKIPVME